MSGYITLAEARAEGIPGDATHDVTDARLQAAIDLWSRFIDDATHQWFDERSVTLYLDGEGAPTMFLPVPIISITSLFMNELFEPASVVDPQFYRVYSSRTVPDDRKNPRISLIPTDRDIFTMAACGANPVFASGKQNQKLVGKFGYLEPDNSTPPLIKRAVMKLLAKSLEPMYSGSLSGALRSGPVQSEKTDAHSITYGFEVASAKGMLGITDDAEVATIIRMYRAPWVLGVPIVDGE